MMYWLVSIVYLFVIFAMANFSLSGSIEAYLVISVSIPFIGIMALLVYKDKSSQ